MSEPSDRRYWVWVTGPDYYLDDDGEERRSLEPGGGFEPREWWTCHRDTQEGDLILLYRRGPRATDDLYDVAEGQFQDIAYLIIARSDAYGLLDDPDAAEVPGWNYGCDYEVLRKFKRPLTFAEMRADPDLAHWGAFRARFQRQAFEVPPDVWDHLLYRLGLDRAKTERVRRRKLKEFTRESEIEDRLSADLGVFKPLGWNLTLAHRQLVCLNGGRADLVCHNRRQNRYVVIELKRGLAGRDCVGQLLDYMASVKRQLRARARPHGIVVASRLDNAATGMIADNERLDFVSLSELGFK